MRPLALLGLVVLGTSSIMATPPAAAAALRPPPAHAPQRGTVHGRVIERASRTPVPGVAVTLVGTTLGALTDDDGRFRIAGIPDGARVIAARRIGYEPTQQSVTVTEGADLTIDFELTKAATQLSEVVTTATGDQRKLEIGNAIGSISVDSVVGAAPITNLTDLISTRVVGVQVLPNTGVTGSSPRIRIRGFNSLSVSNAPLMIIDGVRVENSTGGSDGFGWTSGRVSDYNPDEIESMDIVKGPSAATLYGTDAANGVILIKTRRGRVGSAQWRLYGETGRITQPSSFNTDYYAFGHTPTGGQLRCANLARAANLCALDSLASINPMRESNASPVGTGRRNVAGAQVSGGVERFRYFISGEREEETGYLQLSASEIARLQKERGGVAIPDEQIHPNYLKKTSVRANVTSDIGTKADVTIVTGLILQQSQVPNSNVFSNAAWGVGYKDALEGWSGYRPGEAFAVRSMEDVTHVISSASGNWRPRGWLTGRGTVGLDFSSNFFDNLQRRGEGPPGIARDGRRQNVRTNIGNFTGDLGASAAFTPRAYLSSKTSVGAQYNRRLQRRTSAIGTGLPPGSETVTGAASISGQESTVEQVVAGAYVEQTFGWRDRVFLAGAVRTDGGSTFGANFKTAVYPKASLSWVLSEEPFFPKGRALSSLRYRLAYGSSGVQPSAIAALPQEDLVTVFTGGATTSGARLRALGNADLKPERQTELETGVDLEMWGGRVRFEGTFYNRQSKDALIERSIPVSVGITATGRQENLGAVRNRGWEGLLNARLLDRAAFAVDLTLNGYTNANKLTKLAANVRPPEDRFIKFVEGYPLFGQWDRPVLGFKDLNGDGVLQTNEVQVGDSVVFLGNTNPTRVLTAIPAVTLFGGRVRFSSTFEYKGGWVQTNFSELNKCFFAACRAVNDPKAPLKEQAAFIAFNTPEYGRTYAGYEQDGSFTRWREASLSLELPARYARMIRAREASLVLSARNLKLWSKYKGLDPEVTQNPNLTGNGGAVWDLGYDNPVSPQSRYWIVRLNLGY